MPKLDKVDQDILKEMHAEGDMTDEEYKEKTGQDPPVKEPSEKKTEEKKEEKGTEGEPSEEEKIDEKKKDEEKSEEKEKEKGKEKEEEELITRTPMVPLSKHKKLKERYRELKEQVATGEKTKEEAKKEIDEELGKYAEDNKLDKDQLERLIGIITKRVGKPAEKEKTDEEKKTADKEKLDARLAKEAIGFDSEFEKNVLPILAKKYPKMTAIQERKVKNILYKLAFSKELAETPLKYIYYGQVKKIKEVLDIPSKKSGETSRGTGGGGKKKSFGGLPLDREPTTEEFNAATDEEFDAWNEAKEKRSGSRLIFRDGNK